MSKASYTSIKNIIDNALRHRNVTTLRGGDSSQLVIDSEALSIKTLPLGKEVCRDSASYAINPTIEYGIKRHISFPFRGQEVLAWIQE